MVDLHNEVIQIVFVTNDARNLARAALRIEGQDIVERRIDRGYEAGAQSELLGLGDLGLCRYAEQEIGSNPLPLAFVGTEKERLVLDDWTAE